MPAVVPHPRLVRLRSRTPWHAASSARKRPAVRATRCTLVRLAASSLPKAHAMRPRIWASSLCRVPVSHQLTGIQLVMDSVDRLVMEVVGR